MTHSLYLALSPNRAQAFKCCYRGRTEQSKVSSQLYICAAVSPIRTYSGNMDIKEIQLWLPTRCSERYIEGHLMNLCVRFLRSRTSYILYLYPSSCLCTAFGP